MGAAAVRDRAWPQRLLRASCLAITATGVAMLPYVRPGFDRWRPGTDPGRVGWHLEFVGAVDGVHLLAGGLMVIAVLAAAWQPAGAAAAGRRRSWAIALGAALLVGWLTGMLVPWNRLLPWAEHVGPNRARPALVAESEGPFPELVGVQASYEPGRYPVAGRSVGQTGLVVLVVLHALAGPLAWAAWKWRRRRAA